MILKQPAAELNTDHSQQSWYGVTEILHLMQNGVRLWNLNRCKIKDSCEVCCFVFPSRVEFCFLRFGLFSIMTTRRLIWIHISWPGIWYRGNGLRGPMRTQRGAPAVQLHLPICLWCCRPPLHRELHFLPERSSGRWLHAEHANFTYIYKYRSTHAYTFNEPALHQHAIGHDLSELGVAVCNICLDKTPYLTKNNPL